MSDKRGGKAAGDRHPTLSPSQRSKGLNLLNPACHRHDKHCQVSAIVVEICLHQYMLESPCHCDVPPDPGIKEAHLLHLKSIQQSAVPKEAVSCIDFPFILIIIYLLIYPFTFTFPPAVNKTPVGGRIVINRST